MDVEGEEKVQNAWYDGMWKMEEKDATKAQGGIRNGEQSERKGRKSVEGRKWRRKKRKVGAGEASG